MLHLKTSQIMGWNLYSKSVGVPQNAAAYRITKAHLAAK